MSEIDRARARWSNLRIRSEAPAVPTTEAEAPEPSESQRLHSGSFIGLGAVFEGTLKLQGDFHIDTEFHGELRTDGTLVVGPAASVLGDIHAREVIVDGAVVGTISARRQLTLRAGSRVHGDLETACLEVRPHAFFQGQTSMTRPQDASRETAPKVTAKQAGKSAGKSVSASL
jgi:cytoskeletal protein CcmA (bactofilin family)